MLTWLTLNLFDLVDIDLVVVDLVDVDFVDVDFVDVDLVDVDYTYASFVGSARFENAVSVKYQQTQYF